MRPPISGSTITRRNSFSTWTAFQACSIGSVVMRSVNGNGYTRPLLPWYTRFSRNIGFLSAAAGRKVGIVTCSNQALTGPISLAGAVGSLIGLKVIFLPAGQVILSDFLKCGGLQSCVLHK